MSLARRELWFTLASEHELTRFHGLGAICADRPLAPGNFRGILNDLRLRAAPNGLALALLTEMINFLPRLP